MTDLSTRSTRARREANLGAGWNRTVGQTRDLVAKVGGIDLRSPQGLRVVESYQQGVSVPEIAAAEKLSVADVTELLCRVKQEVRAGKLASIKHTSKSSSPAGRGIREAAADSRATGMIEKYRGGRNVQAIAHMWRCTVAEVTRILQSAGESLSPEDLRIVESVVDQRSTPAVNSESRRDHRMTPANRAILEAMTATQGSTDTDETSRAMRETDFTTDFAQRRRVLIARRRGEPVMIVARREGLAPADVDRITTTAVVNDVQLREVDQFTNESTLAMVREAAADPWATDLLDELVGEMPQFGGDGSAFAALARKRGLDPKLFGARR